MRNKSRWSVLALSVLTLFVIFTGCMGNRVPQILSVTVTPNTPGVNGTATLLCDANDPDGDSLSFFWEVTGGSIVDDHLNPGQWVTPATEGTYRVKVSVSDNRGGIVYGGLYVDVVIPPAARPTPVLLNDPTGVVDTLLVLTWSQNTDEDFASYAVHQSPTSGFTPSSSTLIATLDTRTDTTYTVTGLTGHTDYYYQVVVWDTSGLDSPSNEVHAFTMGPPPTAVTLRPPDPEDVGAFSVGLIWTRNADPNFTEYEVHRGTTPNFVPDAATRVTRLALSTDTTYTVGSLSPGITYYFKILVRNDEARTSLSNEVSATTDQYYVSGYCQVGGRALSVKYWNNYGYVAADDRGVRMIYADPANPTEVGSYVITGRAYDLDVQNGRVYVAYSDSLMIFDAANLGRLGALYMPSPCYSVAVAPPYAYVGVYETGLFTAVRVVNVADPAAPFIEGSINIPNDRPHDIAVSGLFVYVADGRYGLQIIDATNKFAPVLVGGYDEVQDKSYGVTVSEDIAYIASGSEGLLIVDVADRQNPHFLNSYNTPGYAKGVAVFKPVVYVADGGAGLQVFDITVPANPILKSTASTGGYIVGVDATATHAYLADEDYRFLVVSW